MSRNITLIILCAFLAFLPVTGSAQLYVPKYYQVQWVINPIAVVTDAATVYMGASALAPEGTVNVRRQYFVTNGRIVAAHITVMCLTAAGAADNSTLSLRLNDTTDFTVSAAVRHNHAAGSVAIFSNAAMNIPVVAGTDYVQGKLVYATHATTDPANCYYTVLMKVEES